MAAPEVFAVGRSVMTSSRVTEGCLLLLYERNSFPKSQPNEILFKVEWGGVISVDEYTRSNLHPNSVPVPFTSGSEAADVIVQLPTDPDLLKDPEYQARNYKARDHVVVNTRRSFQEYVAQSRFKALLVPSTVPTRSAAALAISGYKALTFITRADTAKAGEWVLVHAAAGGLGTVLCQILSVRGVHVIGGEGVHGIYDGINHDNWEQNFEVIRRKGTIVPTDNASGTGPPFSLKLAAKDLKGVRPVYVDRHPTDLELTAWFGMTFLLRPSVASEEGEP